MLFLKQSTASQTVLIGPFVDDTDGATAETGLTIANTDIRLSKNGGNLGAKNSGGGTHDEAGWYQITLDATDSDTVGKLQLHVKVAGALMVHHEFMVLEEAIYDALIGASAAGFDANGRVDVGSVLGTAQTAGDIVSLLQSGGIQKNTATNDIPMLLVDSTDHATPKTGVSPTLTRSLDGAAFAAKDAGTTVAEIGTTGIYQIDAAAADLNGDIVVFKLSATGADDSFLTIRTVS